MRIVIPIAAHAFQEYNSRTNFVRLYANEGPTPEVQPLREAVIFAFTTQARRRTGSFMFEGTMKTVLVLTLLVSTLTIFAQTTSNLSPSAQKAVDAALYDASLDGDIEAVQKAIKDGADVNSYYSNGRTPLMAAALSLHYKVIDALLKAGARAEMQNDAGETAAGLLGYAKTPPDVGEAEGTPLMRFMAEKKAYEKKLNEAAAPKTELARQLINAIVAVDRAAAMQLIAKGAYVDFKDARSRLVPTVLIVATEKGLADVVEALIKKGVRIDRADAQGRTALYYAVGRGNLELVKMLIAAGADRNKKAANGQTIVDLAKARQNAEIITELERVPKERDVTQEFLANAPKIEIDLRSLPEKLSASIAQLKTTRPEKDQKLLDLIINGPGSGQSVLEYITAMTDMLANGANVNTKSDAGRTLLIIAASNNDSPAVMALLNAKPKLDEQDPIGMTALMHAVSQENIALVGELLKRGASIALKDTKGKTAYDLAAEKKGSVLALHGRRLKVP
jgi:ankyrin repeat protein